VSFLLDTNICSAVIRDDRRVFNRLIQHAGRLSTSSIVLGELYAWAYGSVNPQRLLDDIDDLLKDLVVLEFDDACAQEFGKLKGPLRRQGINVAPLDLLIASTAIAHGFTLVTHNTKDFANIPSLTVMDWLEPEHPPRPIPPHPLPDLASTSSLPASARSGRRISELLGRRRLVAGEAVVLNKS
jgi:tRNA(fMet)-specific endonuclease VapC